jgi:hypothetical protein
VIGDKGATLAVVDLNAGVVSPRKGLSLKALGLRASGIAGHNQEFWVSAWRLDKSMAAVEHLVYGIACGKMQPGLSFEKIERGLAAHQSASAPGTARLVVHHLTGRNSGFFAMRQQDGTERLWHVNGTTHTLVASADAFGGLAAADDAVAYASRHGSEYALSLWRANTALELFRGNEPMFYPALAADRAAVVAATLSSATKTMQYFVASEQDHPVRPKPLPVPSRTSIRTASN